MIYTLGYGNRSFDLFLSLLRRYSVSALVDTRSHPFSRHNPNYNQAALSAHLVPLGIEYHFLGRELGGRPADPLYYTAGQVDYSKLAASPAFLTGIQTLVALSTGHAALAILCSELRPEFCHRSRLIAPALLALGIPVEHISETGAILTHAEVNLRCPPDLHQPPLFL